MKKAWVPTLEFIDINEKQSVIRIAKWTEGEGDSPEAGGYIGINGVVLDISKAVKLKSVKQIIIDIKIGINNKSNPYI